MKKLSVFFVHLFCLWFITGCLATNKQDTTIPEIPVIVSPTKTSQSITVPETVTVIPQVVETPIPTVLPISIFSPLTNYSMDELVKMVSNPYNPPASGSDDPHQGVDFSVIDQSLQIALKGEDIQAVIGGSVVMSMKDRFPYGNAVLIETSYEKLPAEWIQYLEKNPTPTAFGNITPLSCPSGWDEPVETSKNLSLFVLYAHMDNEPEFEEGDIVESGDGIGKMGESGNTLAPHLHLEMRYGFSESLQGSMGHYNVNSSEDEMKNYCRWRVSGWFRTINPINLLLISTRD